jgi:hypothetical protein
LGAALLATATLTLAACGGSSDGADSTASTTSTTDASSTTTSSSTSTSSAPTTTNQSAATTTSDIRQRFDSTLRQSLVQQGNLNDAQIDCVLGELHKTLPDSEIQASTSKRVPQAVVDAASNAGVKCTQ